MAKNKDEHILTIKENGEERQFLLDDAEYQEFLLRFEENELVDMSGWDVSKIKLVETPAPARN